MEFADARHLLRWLSVTQRMDGPCIMESSDITVIALANATGKRFQEAANLKKETRSDY